MRVLFLATYGDFLATFELSNIKIWQSLGCEVHCASNFRDSEYNRKITRLDEVGVFKHEVCFSRSPFDKSNLKSFSELISLMKREKIDIIDCHNAVIGAFARLAAKICGIKKVIYTPHSLFFYKGCPIKSTLIYKNAESFLARMTDLLISINQEDYEATKKMPLRGKALYVPGVGVDTEEIFGLNAERHKYRLELNIPDDAKLYISVGELIPRKNHICSINAFAKANLENAYYIICGIGHLKHELEELIDHLSMRGRIRLLGYRNDVKELMKASDVYLFPSFQEGLPVALMEAMACGLPCVASKIRGNVDLIDEGKGGYLFNPNDADTMSQLIKSINGDLSSSTMGIYNEKKVKPYDIKNVQTIMRREYLKILEK